MLNFVSKYLFALLLVIFASDMARGQDPAESSEEALAVYADAANFQNNGAFDLAIAEWKKFLSKHGDDPLAAKAWHYLGVSQMRKEDADYQSAAEAFSKALSNKKFDLVEEALSNRGWCLFVAAQNDEEKSGQLYTEALKTFEELLKKFPETTFADQALFYSGEAAYALKQPERAVAFYQRLTQLPKGKQSPLYCDSFYAAGVALEELKKWDDALASYQSLETGCADSELIAEVTIRQADILVLQQKWPEAAAKFQKVAGAKDKLADYALFRYAFCSIQQNDPAAAAAAYDTLTRDYPDSQYAASALMAAGQAYYRAGKFDEAGKKFTDVLKVGSRSDVTEATHWLAAIAMRDGKYADAIALARKAIADGLEGGYASMVKMDLADALSRSPDTSKESIELYKSIAEEYAKEPSGARALYNAAFMSLQIRDMQSADELSQKFIQRYAGDPLLADVLYIAAESKLQTGNAKEAAATYQKLLKSSQDHPSRTVWLLRSGTADFLAESYQSVIDRLSSALSGDQLTDSQQRAEAMFLIGSSYRKLGKSDEAIQKLQESLKTNSQWPQAAEVRLTLGQVLLENKQGVQAEKLWRDVIAQSSTSNSAYQARYQLAQWLSSQEKYEDAQKLYDEILADPKQSSLAPYAMYGSGWCEMKREKYADAMTKLNKVLADYKEHAVAADAQLARAICLRNLGQNDQARAAFEELLKQNPEGISLGHALYELALLETAAKKPSDASKHLKRLVEAVPNYPDLDKVLYELAWAMRDQGDEAAAVEHFKQLVIRFPNTPLAAEGSFHVGQQLFDEGDFQKAAGAFAAAIQNTKDPALLEKAHYKIGWAGYQLKNYDGARRSFEQQLQVAPNGPLKIDALVMIGETYFKSQQFEAALQQFSKARDAILATGNADSETDKAALQVRELAFLHGGQSAQQLKQWNVALEWFDQMRKRYPTTHYLPEVFYETGYCHQQLKQYPQALQYFTEIAQQYRNEIAARARFMMGEILFTQQELTKAIPEFQRVMFGFGGDKAPVEIKNWQAKSAFEAGRCSELLIQNAQGEKKAEAVRIATDFYKYVVQKHPQHELVEKAKQRLDELGKLAQK